MSRWPRGIDAAYLEHEHRERMRRVLALDVRYDSCAAPAPVRVVVDRDPGDENAPGKGGEG